MYPRTKAATRSLSCSFVLNIYLLLLIYVSHQHQQAEGFLVAPSAISPWRDGTVYQRSIDFKTFMVHRDRNDENDEDDDDDDEAETKPSSCNVLGTSLRPCCVDVGGSGIGTGFYRNGYCSTGEQDMGRHTACVEVTDDFLRFSASVGNDLSTPAPQYHFPGLKAGDRWCLCAARWTQAYQAGMAPRLLLHSTHEKTLDYAPLEILRQFALDGAEADRVLKELNEKRDKLNRLL